MKISVLLPRHRAAQITSGAAVLGGTLGWLVGIGMLALPGMSPLVIYGPLVSALTAMGAGAAIGGLAGALSQIGIPEGIAKQLEGHIKRGEIVLSVECSGERCALDARQILKSTGVQVVP
ncbi:hypothetical protein F183_A18880 [Bryobacterales bacterium F-183]|nr:hypothetical protein F183_A18880 [Bryobacterales bacterium F-183]